MRARSRGRTAVAGTLVALAAAAAAYAADPGALPVVPRVHRLHVPAPALTLPATLAVDESEYTLRPSQIVVAAGEVQFNVYNRGMDDHDMTFVDSAGVTQTVAVKAGTSAQLVVALKPGSYRLFCSLFEGTPQSHDALGMHATIDVR